MDSVSRGQNELSVIERCPYYRGVGKERFDCTHEQDPSNHKIDGGLYLDPGSSTSTLKMVSFIA